MPDAIEIPEQPEVSLTPIEQAMSILARYCESCGDVLAHPELGWVNNALDDLRKARKLA